MVALTVCLMVHAEEASPQTLEYRVKSGFLFTIAKYVDWPEGTFSSATNAITIGILGTDPFGKLLDETVVGKKIDGRPVELRRIQSVEEIEGCHVVFISASEKDHMSRIRLRVERTPILTVGDFDGFLQQGGQIGFVAENNRVLFDINLKAVQTAGLKLNANLLRVARQVLQGEEPDIR